MLKLDVFNLIFTVINLGVLFFVVWRFLFKPVRSIIAKRQEEIEQQYAAADQAKEEALGSQKEYEEAMKGIGEEKADILKRGREQAAREYERVLAQANAEAAEILHDARLLAEEDKKHAIKEAQEKITDMVADAAAKIAGTMDNAENDSRLFDEFIAKSGE